MYYGKIIQMFQTTNHIYIYISDYWMMTIIIITIIIIIIHIEQYNQVPFCRVYPLYESNDGEKIPIYFDVFSHQKPP